MGEVFNAWFIFPPVVDGAVVQRKAWTTSLKDVKAKQPRGLGEWSAAEIPAFPGDLEDHAHVVCCLRVGRGRSRIDINNTLTPCLRLRANYFWRPARSAH